MSGRPAPAGPTGAVLTLAWYAVVLLVVFTVAFWVGRTVGPDVEPLPQRPATPHVPMEAH